MSLFSELQRRSVFKVGAAYLVVAWLAIQIASTVFPSFGIPEWALRFLTLALMLGFPIALVMAWVLEVTPDGVKVDASAGGNGRIYAIAGVLMLAALGWYYRGALPVGSAPDGKPRIAVLPLANFSPDPANAFFADGLHDDMLTALSRLKGVDVISRTTMDTFRDSKLTLAEIAAKIGATHVIEGSVRRDDVRVRLTVQLIDARTDDHIWAETYDRPLDASLNLQSAVAKEVAQALKVAIGGDGSDAPPTTVPAAYDLYLKGRVAAVGGPRARSDTLKFYDAALLLDPGFTLARIDRARVACQVVWFDDSKREELVPQIQGDIAHVRSVVPDLAQLSVAEAYYAYYIELDYPKALRLFDATLARHPDLGDAHEGRGYLLRRLDRFDESVVAHRRAIELDPYNFGTITSVAVTLQAVRRYHEANGLLEEAHRRSPDNAAIELAQAKLYRDATGDQAGYLARLERLRGRMPRDEFDDEIRSELGPTAERLAYGVAHAREWVRIWNGLAYPNALDAAWDADHLGETATRDQQVAIALEMFVSFQPAIGAVARTHALHAGLLALRGDAAAAVAEAEAALLESPRSKDSIVWPVLQIDAARALARAGAKARALDLMEAVIGAPNNGFLDASVAAEPFLKKMLADEPRYQALVKTIESRYVKL